MAHFCQVDENGLVVQTVVVANDAILDENGDESETLGVEFCRKFVGSGNWIQTSYNHNFRKQYGRVGFTYDEQAQVFISPSPYPSWVLNASYDWEAPTPEPSEGGPWEWNEATQTWDEIVPPTEEPTP